MAKDRIEPCVHYLSAGECDLGRDASHYSYCQKCRQYKPRFRGEKINYKKKKLERIKEKEFLYDNL